MSLVSEASRFPTASERRSHAPHPVHGCQQPGKLAIRHCRVRGTAGTGTAQIYLVWLCRYIVVVYPRRIRVCVWQHWTGRREGGGATDRGDEDEGSSVAGSHKLQVATAAAASNPRTSSSSSSFRSTVICVNTLCLVCRLPDASPHRIVCSPRSFIRPAIHGALKKRRWGF